VVIPWLQKRTPKIHDVPLVMSRVKMIAAGDYTALVFHTGGVPTGTRQRLQPREPIFPVPQFVVNPALLLPAFQTVRTR
jgi:hypothetical protein